jgi:hypothetical protein
MAGLLSAPHDALLWDESWMRTCAWISVGFVLDIHDRLLEWLASK